MTKVEEIKDMIKEHKALIFMADGLIYDHQQDMKFELASKANAKKSYIREFMFEHFYTIITEWLLPLGYIEVFSNHPCKNIREWHFQKECIRVICVKDYDPYVYLYADILKQPHALGLRTCNFEVLTDKLHELHIYMLNNIKLIK